MNVYTVDPRDISTEIESPIYRVYFSESARSEVGELGSYQEEFEVAGANSVEEVISWARRECGQGRSFVLYARVEDELILLLNSGS